MIRMNKTKKSKFIVTVGYGLTFFCDCMRDVVEIQHAYGNAQVLRLNAE